MDDRENAGWDDERRELARQARERAGEFIRDRAPEQTVGVYRYLFGKRA